MERYSDSSPLLFLDEDQLFSESTNILQKAGLVLEKAGLTLTPVNSQIDSTLKPVNSQIYSAPDNVYVTETLAKINTVESDLSIPTASTNVVNSKQEIPVISTKEIVSKVKCEAKTSCENNVMKGFKFCQHHLFEESKNSNEKCTYISPTTNEPCMRPLTNSDGSSKKLCNMHIAKDVALKNKKLKKKKVPASKHVDVPNNTKKRPSSLAVSQGIPTTRTKYQSSSEEEEFNFYTDTVQVKKTECMWLGNQASDADSTDSEDENPLNHAGVWTLEEVLRICKEKMVRLRTLYAQQFKRMNYHLKEERRKYIGEFDMDPFLLSKVPFYRRTGDLYNDYMEDVHLTNYQRCSGEEIMAEKMMREKRSKGITLHTRRSDLPKCQLNVDGQRCSNKVMPFSKYCSTHILSDNDQYLYSKCVVQEKKCSLPADIFLGTCRKHLQLISRPTEKYWENFITSKKERENRKRKIEEEKEKIPLKATRSSARIREDQRRKISDNSPNFEKIEHSNTDIKIENGFKTPISSKEFFHSPSSSDKSKIVNQTNDATNVISQATESKKTEEENKPIKSPQSSEHIINMEPNKLSNVCSLEITSKMSNNNSLTENNSNLENSNKNIFEALENFNRTKTEDKNSGNKVFDESVTSTTSSNAVEQDKGITSNIPNQDGEIPSNTVTDPSNSELMETEFVGSRNSDSNIKITDYVSENINNDKELKLAASEGNILGNKGTITENKGNDIEFKGNIVENKENDTKEIGNIKEDFHDNILESISEVTENIENIMGNTDAIMENNEHVTAKIDMTENGLNKSTQSIEITNYNTETVLNDSENTNSKNIEPTLEDLINTDVLLDENDTLRNIEAVETVDFLNAEVILDESCMIENQEETKKSFELSGTNFLLNENKIEEVLEHDGEVIDLIKADVIIDKSPVKMNEFCDEEKTFGSFNKGITDSKPDSEFETLRAHSSQMVTVAPTMQVDGTIEASNQDSAGSKE